MAKTLVFEGCPACKEPGYGQLVLPKDKEYATAVIQGGAIGAAAATVLDMLVPRIPVVKGLPVAIRPLVGGSIAVIASMLLYKKNPPLAVGIGVGGVAIAAYKLIAVLMGKVAVAPAPVKGVGETGQVEEEPPLEITGTGVIVPIEEERAGAVSGLYGWGEEEEILVE